MDWLRDAVIELFTRLFNFLFTGTKQKDAAPPGKFEEQAKDKLKKEGW